MAATVMQATPHVGVMYLNLPNGAKNPCRVFFPAQKHEGVEGVNKVGWFTTSMAHYTESFLHVVFKTAKNSLFLSQLLRCFSVLLAWLNPYSWCATLPGCFASDGETGARPLAPSSHPKDRTGGYPVVLFSHGLTGTGEENALMLASWAQCGYVVVAGTHCDGSASRVSRVSRSGESGSTEEEKKEEEKEKQLFYQHPDLANYDPDFRPRQVVRREEELWQIRQFVVESPEFPQSVRDVMDVSQVFVAGFSYGAATASLSVAKRPTAYKACILLDGWFHIDLADIKSLNTTRHFDFPAEAHKTGLDIPALFIGSEQFAQREKLADATNRLAKNNRSKVGSTTLVLEGSVHNTFCDVGFWLPIRLMRWLKFSFLVGSCDYLPTYQRILLETRQFLLTHTQND